MRSFPFVQTSVFTDDRYAFSGNQLATFWDYESNARLSFDEMQGITREMNYSETTFAFPPVMQDCVSKVRIFTPAREIPFAGHPTLGTAFVLRSKKLIKADHAALELGIGRTEVDFITEDMVRMVQNPPEFLGEVEETKKVLSAIGLTEKAVSDDHPMQFVSTGFPFLIIPLKSLPAVQKAAPNPVAIARALEGQASRAVLIFSTETVHGESNAHARMFAPDVGVLEDPATGSAAGPLGAYLEHHHVLPTHVNGEIMTVEQGYEMHRPSRLLVQMARDKRKGKVLVSGKVRLTADGVFYLKSPRKQQSTQPQVQDPPPVWRTSR